MRTMTESAAFVRETNEGVALITVDRPERRNALSTDAWLELRGLLGGLRSDPEIRGMILTGAGDRAFAAGADLTELADRDPLVALDGLVQSIVLELEALPFPTIAALNGHALGGGWELALACDFRIAVTTAKVGFPEVGLGIIPGAGGTRRLLQHVGIGRAKELILTSRMLEAEEAEAYGLVNRVVGPGELLDAARSLMKVLVSQPRLAMRVAKLLIDAAARGEAGPDLERVAYTLTFHAPDRSERMHRFLEQHAARPRE